MYLSFFRIRVSILRTTPNHQPSAACFRTLLFRENAHLMGVCGGGGREAPCSPLQEFAAKRCKIGDSALRIKRVRMTLEGESPWSIERI